MNPSETAFLVLGLVAGATIGLALWPSARSRLAPRREVRITITPNSIPARRAATLATPGGHRYPGPLPGSPDGDARPSEFAAPAWLIATPTPISTAPAWSGGIPVRTPVLDVAPSIPADAVAVAIVGRDDRDATPAWTSIDRATVLASMVAAAPGRGTATPASASTRGHAGVAVLETPPTAASETVGQGDGGEPGPGSAPGTPADAGPGSATGAEAADACADERSLVDERCAVATAAREEARRTADALHEAQRAYDALQERVDRAREVADPRRVADAKTHLHATFRAASDASTGPEEAEAAARAWLDAINRLNAAVRDADRLTEIGRADLQAQLVTLERLGVEADAARIAAEHAADVCQDARQRLAACEEAATRAATEAIVPAEPEDEHPFARVWPAEEPALTQAAPPPADGGVSSIIRVLRGDRDARERIVAALAGDDADAQREWQLRLAHLVDAITARAIEDGYLVLPDDDPFWGLFEAREARDIVGALSALGFRYDGMGGFADGRVPATRDLTLAVGYAGLDRMRIRAWPREDSMDGLYVRAAVATDEWLADVAGDLSLGRMVDALGSRAAALADTWNAWGRVRPVLLAE